MVLGALALACGGTAPAAAPPVRPTVDPAAPIHPLAQRQATAQAEQAPALQQAQAAAATAVAERAAAAAAALEQAKAEAVNLLGAANSLRQQGQLGQAIELARQAQAKWPDYEDAKRFLADVAPQATAAAREAQAQATAQARSTPRPPAPPAPRPGGQPTPRPAPTADPVRPVPTTAADQALIGRALDIIAAVDVEALRELALVLVQRQVTITFGALPAGAGAVWQPPENRITIGTQYRTSSAQGIAGVLVHEATHAYDHYRGRDSGTVQDCYDLEGRAFANQARFWETLYGRGGKPGATDPLERQLNNILFVVNEKPLTFAVELLQVYRHQCS